MAFSDAKAVIEELPADQSEAFSQLRYRVRLSVWQTTSGGSPSEIAWAGGWKTQRADAIDDGREALAYDPADLDLDALYPDEERTEIPEGTAPAAGFPDSQLDELNAALDALVE